MVAILFVATGLVSGCAASRGSATIRPGPAELEDPGSEDWVRELGSDRPQARAWALSEIESHYEAARQRGEDAERRLRDQLVEPLVEAYLRRFPPEPSVHDEEHWAEMNAEELRMLEYSQRLRDLARNVMVPQEGSVGTTLYLGAAEGGAQALGREAGRLEVGALADLMAFDTTHVSLCALRPDQLLDGLCFASDDSVVSDVWSAGRHVVSGGRHAKRDQIIAAYASAVAALLDAL